MGQCFCGRVGAGGALWEGSIGQQPLLQAGPQGPQTLGSHWCWQGLLGLPRFSEDICPRGPVVGSFSNLPPCLLMAF